MRRSEKNKNHFLIILFVGILSIIPYFQISKTTHSIENYKETNSVSEIEKYLKYIKNNITVGSVLTSMDYKQNNLSINIYNSNNELKDNDSKIVSGDIIEILYNGETKIKYVISVMGDSNGDGELNTQDLVQMRKHIVEWIDPQTGKVYKKNGAYLHSLDLNQDGTVNTQDLVRMRKTIVGYPVEENSKDIVAEDMFKINTATFDKNGAKSIGNSQVQCISFDKDSCDITMPNITTEGTVIGWNTNKNATTAEIKPGEKLKLTSNKTYYAITKREYTATFDDDILDYIEYKEISCNAYNKETSCEIILPEFNKLGHFNSFWGTTKTVSSNLTGTTRDLKQFNPVGYSYKLTKDMIFYPNINHFSYSTVDSNYTKFRSINANKTVKVGNTTFEFEEGIPQNKINEFISEMEKAYEYFPFLYNKGKAFVMTKSTYETYSIAYGLCHNMYLSYGGDAYFTIDLQYDTNNISVNAALHELAHAWDDYYYYVTNTTNEKGVYKPNVLRLNSRDDFNEFYNLIKSKLYVESDEKLISKVETFAGMFTNYYWHVLKVDDTKQHYALKTNEKLNESELLALKNLMEKYINMAKNNYK